MGSTLNNQAAVSHEPTRQRERQMRGFKSVGHLQGNPETQQRDRRIRETLRNRGYWVFEIAATQLSDRGAMVKHFAKLARLLLDRTRRAGFGRDALVPRRTGVGPRLARRGARRWRRMAVTATDWFEASHWMLPRTLNWRPGCSSLGTQLQYETSERRRGRPARRKRHGTETCGCESGQLEFS